MRLWDIVKQKEILFGGLLGDLCIRKHNKNYRGHVVHSITQLEYAQYLYKELNNLSGIFRFIKVKANNKLYDECQFTLRPNLNLKFLYEAFYDNFGGKKDIPFDLSLLTPQAIAIWFMDDGSSNNGRYFLHTNCFNLKSIFLLQNMLKHNFNIYSSIEIINNIFTETSYEKKFL